MVNLPFFAWMSVFMRHLFSLCLQHGCSALSACFVCVDVDWLLTMLDEILDLCADFEWFELPVDTTMFAHYHYTVPYPSDLYTIMERLKLGYYRSIAAVLQGILTLISPISFFCLQVLNIDLLCDFHVFNIG